MILITMMRTRFPAMTLPMRTSMEPGVQAKWLPTEMEGVGSGQPTMPKLEVSEPLVSCLCVHHRSAHDQNNSPFFPLFVPNLGTNICLWTLVSQKVYLKNLAHAQGIINFGSIKHQLSVLLIKVA